MEVKHRRWVRSTLWIGLIGLALLVMFDRSTGIDLRAADEAPAASRLMLRYPDGRGLSIDELEGRVVLVNVWASWCGPCRREIPALSRVQSRFADRGLQVLGVNVESFTPDELLRVSGELGVEYDVVVPEGVISGTFDWQGTLPHTWLVDRHGRVRASREGLVREGALANAVERLLEEE